MVNYKFSDIRDEQNHHILPQIILLLLLVVGTGCSHTSCFICAKDVLDLQELKVFTVSADTSRFTFGCGASVCVIFTIDADILQLT